MQKLISKYGLAAHLAIAAVAPLFLSPVCVLLFSLLAAIWLVMSPSRIGSESMVDARRRVVTGVIRDPILWVSLSVVAIAFVRFVNGGIAMSYDAEKAVWTLVGPVFSLLPGSVDGRGFAEFSASVSMAIVLMGCRYGLGKSARMGFLLTCSCLSSIGFGWLMFRLSQGNPEALKAMNCLMVRPSFSGAAAGLYLLVGTVALLGVQEHKWLKFLLPAMASVAAGAAALFVFAPPAVQILFATAEALIVVYALVYARYRVQGAGEFLFLVSNVLSLAMGAIIVMVVMPPKSLDARLAAYLSLDFVPETFLATRQALGDLSLRIWKSHPWVGNGLGSFPLGLRFLSGEADWLLVSAQQTAPLNGYWKLLAEAGIVGAASIACVLGFLLWAYFKRLIKGVLIGFPHPACWLGPVLLVVVLVESLVDVSYSIPGMTSAVAVLLALSANSFAKEENNG